MFVAPSADHRRRHAGAFKWGSTGMSTPKMPTASRFTTGRSSIGFSTRTWNADSSLTCRSVSCPRPFRRIRNTIRTSAEDKRRRRTPARPIRRKITAKWGELCHQWAKHCVEKYGQAEVEKWYWEVWNEPNIFYWHGGDRGMNAAAVRQEYFKLYDYAVDGVRQALPSARVGGPETAGGAGGPFLREFLEHCARGTNYATGKTGSPLDFISFHAKGNPQFVDGHVRMGMSNQLRDINGLLPSSHHSRNTRTCRS